MTTISLTPEPGDELVRLKNNQGCDEVNLRDSLLSAGPQASVLDSQERRGTRVVERCGILFRPVVQTGGASGRSRRRCGNARMPGESGTRAGHRRSI